MTPTALKKIKMIGRELMSVQRNVVYLLTIVILTSCVSTFTKNEIVGRYVAVGYENTFDTIQLKLNHTYTRKVYNKNNGLVINMSDKWLSSNLENNQIKFYSFFLNLDRDLIKYPELANDTLGGQEVNLEYNDGKSEFCAGYFPADLSNQNCYHKLDEID